MDLPGMRFSEQPRWLTCKSDPAGMLTALHNKASRRKLLLFAVACSRRVWHLLSGEYRADTLTILERSAESGDANREHFLVSLGFLASMRDRGPDCRAHRAVWSACQLGKSEGNGYDAIALAARTSDEVQDALGAEAEARALAAGALLSVAAAEYAKVWRDEVARHCNWIRDLLSDRFLRSRFDSHWLQGNHQTARNMAQAIYEGQSFGEMPILADALEEVGCANEEILSHCRQPGEHIRGCWVLDLLLGKS